MQAFLQYITAVCEDTFTPRLDYLFSFHMAKPYRDLAFTRFVGQQRAIQRMVHVLTGEHGRATLIGFGNMCSRDPSGLIKGCPAGPVKRLLRALSHACTVVMVDEFRTSKLHGDGVRCAGEMRAMKGKVKPRPHRRHGQPWVQDGADQQHGTAAVALGPVVGEVYSVRVCKDCNARVNRDVNAARNMLAMLLASLKGDRPPRFCRGVSL